MNAAEVDCRHKDVRMMSVCLRTTTTKKKNKMVEYICLVIAEMLNVWEGKYKLDWEQERGLEYKTAEDQQQKKQNNIW